MKPLLEVTGQRWKLWLLGAALAGSALVCWIGVRHGNPVLTLAAAGVGLGTFGVCALSIRCLRCSCKLLWHALRNNSVSTWMGSLWTMTHCPSRAWPASEDTEAASKCDVAVDSRDETRS
jgi:hypothetical protein